VHLIAVSYYIGTFWSCSGKGAVTMEASENDTIVSASVMPMERKNQSPYWWF
jgi:hypothetical protein